MLVCECFPIIKMLCRELDVPYPLYCKMFRRVSKSVGPQKDIVVLERKIEDWSEMLRHMGYGRNAIDTLQQIVYQIIGRAKIVEKEKYQRHSSVYSVIASWAIGMITGLGIGMIACNNSCNM